MAHSGQDSSDPGNDRIPLFENLIATAGFVGYIPWASGTFGSLLGLGIVFIPGVGSPLPLAILIIVFLFLGVRSSRMVASIIGNRLTRTAEFAKEKFQTAHSSPDPSIVVIDEVVGMWVSLLFIPLYGAGPIVAFLSFRVFDIIKPPPARQTETIPNGWGIMLDDVVAGVYANIMTHVFLALFPALAHV